MFDNPKENDDTLGCIFFIIIIMFMLHTCDSLSNIEKRIKTINSGSH
jgi:hypothetical protein